MFSRVLTLKFLQYRHYITPILVCYFAVNNEASYCYTKMKNYCWFHLRMGRNAILLTVLFAFIPSNSQNIDWYIKLKIWKLEIKYEHYDILYWLIIIYVTPCNLIHQTKHLILYILFKTAKAFNIYLGY